MRRIRYDFVSSIGHYCGAAMYMRRHCLRSMSGPLDWVGEDPGGLANHVDIICRDFRGFMDKANLIPLVNPRTAIDDLANDYYRDGGTGILTYHDFPTGVSLDESYGNVRARFDRRIRRFYETVAAARHVLLIFQTKTQKLTEPEVASAAARLREKLGSHVDLLVVESVPGMAGLDVQELSPGVDYARGWLFRPEKHWIMGDRDLYDRIYSRIRCKGRLKRRMQKRFRKWIRRFQKCTGRGQEE